MRLDDPQLLAALARLESSNDFRKFTDIYLAGLEKEYLGICVASDSPARAQGAVQVLQEIRRDIGASGDAYLRLTELREVPLSNQ